VELTFPVITQPQFTEPSQYLNIILRASQTAVRSCAWATWRVREIGLQQYIVNSSMNGVPATIIAVYQTAGRERARRVRAVRKTMAGR